MANEYRALIIAVALFFGFTLPAFAQNVAVTITTMSVSNGVLFMEYTVWLEDGRMVNGVAQLGWTDTDSQVKTKVNAAIKAAVLNQYGVTLSGADNIRVYYGNLL